MIQKQNNVPQIPQSPASSFEAKKEEINVWPEEEKQKI